VVRITRRQLGDYAHLLLAFCKDDECFVANDSSSQSSPIRKGSNKSNYRDQIHGLVWKSFDSLFRVAFRIKHLDEGESHLFCLVQRRYLGKSFSVDGVLVRRFDPVIEIHMNNKLLAQILRDETSVVSVAARLIKETRRSLPALAKCVSSHQYEKATVLYGTTFIHRGVERFGFSTYPINSQTTHRFLAWYLRNILRMANPNARDLLKSRPDVWSPKIVAISKERLIQEYAGAHPGDVRTVAEVSHC
jgi:hypothetical protein